MDLAPLLPYGATGLYLAGAVIAADLVKEAIRSRRASKPPANEGTLEPLLRRVEGLCERILEAVTRTGNQGEGHHKSRNAAENRLLDAIQQVNERLIRMEARRG